ncbi:hypothetical protein SISNIDRAFT_482990 [Sistotremastrum niveocremeum HHB9708]|uniref:Uncharacterized protein n=1 Tax=Sistotremastrum niveocremeum HHB9708 TaxID=1314777 RepID=A0A164XZ11_9AGAM|nr:hypothetical protein SISNIDRAFT_482990 [Sistotremastrum niveocremeum HHB9708]
MDTYDKQSVKKALVALSRELRAVIQDIDHIVVDVESSETIRDRGQLTSQDSTDAQESLRQLSSRVMDHQFKATRSFMSTLSSFSEQSNRHARIFSLPEEVLSEILTRYMELEMRVDHESGRRVVLPYSWANIMTVYVLRERSSLTCRNWNRIIYCTPAVWSFIDLSWPRACVQKHVSLAKDAPYHIFWDVDVESKMPKIELLTKDRKPIRELRVRDMSWEALDQAQSYFFKFWDSWVPRTAAYLKQLHIILPPNYNVGPDTCLDLPDMTNLQHLRLVNCYTKSTVSSSLLTIDCMATTGDSTSENISRILSGCPLLTSVILHMKRFVPDGGDDSPSEDVIPPSSFVSNPVILSHLRELQLHSFSLTEVQFLLENIVIATLPSFSTSIIVSRHSTSSFYIPESFKHFARCAKHVAVKGKSLRYSKGSEYTHEFFFNQSSHEYGPESTSGFASVAHYFKSVESLTIDLYKPVDNAMWVNALSSFHHLKELVISGLQRDLFEILKALADTKPLLCPNLRVLALLNHAGIYIAAHQSIFGVNNNRPGEDAVTTAESQNLLELAADQLELMLTRRDELGIRIQKLILPLYSSWDSRDWKSHVDNVVIQ